MEADLLLESPLDDITNPCSLRHSFGYKVESYQIKLTKPRISWAESTTSQAEDRGAGHDAWPKCASHDSNSFQISQS